MQAGGRRFDPVILHQELRWSRECLVCCELPFPSAVEVCVSRFDVCGQCVLDWVFRHLMKFYLVL